MSLSSLRSPSSRLNRTNLRSIVIFMIRVPFQLLVYCRASVATAEEKAGRPCVVAHSPVGYLAVVSNGLKQYMCVCVRVLHESHITTL